MTLNSDLLPPFPSLIFPEGKTKFLLSVDCYNEVSPKKKLTFALKTNIYGIIYNSDKFNLKSINDWKKKFHLLLWETKKKEQTLLQSTIEIL